MTLRLGKIYKISNDINSKVYIGLTILSIEDRFRNHYNKDPHNNSAIKRAIMKYGKDHFVIEVIEDNILLKDLDDREIYWISFYKSNIKEFGYNLTKGGNSSFMENKLSNLQQEKLCYMYLQGFTLEQIIEEFKITKKTLYRYLNLNGIEVDREKNRFINNRVNIEELKKYIKDKFPTITLVVQVFNVSRGTIYNIIKQSKDSTLRLNPSNPRKSHAELNEDAVCEMYMNDYNIQDIMKEFHSSKLSVSLVLKDHKIKVQRNRSSKLNRI